MTLYCDTLVVERYSCTTHLEYRCLILNLVRPVRVPVQSWWFGRAMPTARATPMRRGAMGNLPSHTSTIMIHKFTWYPDTRVQNLVLNLVRPYQCPGIPMVFPDMSATTHVREDSGAERPAPRPRPGCIFKPRFSRNCFVGYLVYPKISKLLF
jgi:hypothetical protein